MAKAQAEHAHKVEDLVREKNLPMAFLATQVGFSPFKTWSALIRHSNLHVSIAYGTTEEQTKEHETALKVTSVCVDFFALMTLRLINRIELLPKLFTKIYVHIATFESIANEIRDLETQKEAFSITYHKGKLVRSEISPEEIKLALSFLIEIREFLKCAPVELIGVDPAIRSQERTKKITEALGDLHYETMLAAKLRGVCTDVILKFRQPEALFAHFLGNLGSRTFMNPELFFGITGWIFRSGKLSRSLHELFYIGVQQTILEMCSLAKLEAPWWPELRQKWKFMGQINIILSRRGWL